MFFFAPASFVRNVQFELKFAFVGKFLIPEEDSVSERAACKCEAEFVKDTFFNSVLTF